MEYEEKVCEFKRYVKQSLDLMIDAFKWRCMAHECEDEITKQKYMSVSNTLFEMFMKEHQNIGEMFKAE